MKILILNIILLFISIQTIAQEFGTVGTEWYYNEQFAFSGDIDYIKFVSEKDTLVDGMNCKKITKRHKIGCNDRPGVEFLYTSNDTVFFLDTIFNEFQILYIFNLNQNDSWSIKIKDEIQNIDTIIVTVDSTTVSQINGFDLQTMYVTYHKQSENNYYQSDYNSTIIERIGDIKYMFNWDPWSELACDYNWTSGLRCYQDSELGLYSTGIDDSCNYTYEWTNIEFDDVKFDFNIYPNPAKETLTINTDFNKKIDIELININGRVLISEEIYSEKKINIKNINSGLYLLIIRNGEKIIKMEKIIIE